MQGVNNRQDLAAASTFLRRRINARWMQEGVTMIDPETTYIESTVILEPDVILGPNVHLRGETRVARDAHIDTGCVLTNSSVGQGSHLLPHSVVTDSAIASSAARAMCALRVPRVNPQMTPRASAFQCGAPSPARLGNGP